MSLLKHLHVKKCSSVLPSAARGDTFVGTEEVTEEVTTLTASATTVTPTLNTVATTIPASPRPTNTQGPTPPVDTDAAPCSGRPFDAFLQLKNGSIYAFRGKPGHPKGFLSYKCIYVLIFVGYPG